MRRRVRPPHRETLKPRPLVTLAPGGFDPHFERDARVRVAEGLLAYFRTLGPREQARGYTNRFHSIFQRSAFSVLTRLRVASLVPRYARRAHGLRWGREPVRAGV